MKRFLLAGLVVAAAGLGAYLWVSRSPEAPPDEGLYRLGQPKPGAKSREELWKEAEAIGVEYSNILDMVERMKREADQRKAAREAGR